MEKFFKVVYSISQLNSTHNSFTKRVWSFYLEKNEYLLPTHVNSDLNLVINQVVVGGNVFNAQCISTSLAEIDLVVP